MTKTMPALCGFWLLVVIGMPAQEAKPKFTTFEVTGAGTGEYQGTLGQSINSAGVITGYYIDGSGVYHGYMRAASGAITRFNAAGSGTAEYQGTVAVGINTGGAIAGYYADSSNVYHGFLRAAGGKITAINAPDAGTGAHQGTYASSINTGGVITGRYTDAKGVTHGYVRAADGTITSFDPKGSTLTVPESINDSGAIAGFLLGLIDCESRLRARCRRHCNQVRSAWCGHHVGPGNLPL